MAQIISFRLAQAKPPEHAGTESAPAAEVIVFPRTDICSLRRMWGVPAPGPLLAGREDRAVAAATDVAGAE